MAPICGGGKKKEAALKKAADDKLNALKRQIELEMLAEAEEETRALELQAKQERDKADFLEDEVRKDTGTPDRIEQQKRDEITKLRQQLGEKQQERSILAAQLEALTLQTMNEKKEREGEQYDKMITLQNEVQEFKASLEEKINREVRLMKCEKSWLLNS